MNAQKKHSTLERLFLTVIVAVTALTYVNSFQGQFSLDDFVNIINDPSITSLDFSLSGISNAASGGRNVSRWLPNISFGINFLLHGENVWGYHLVNLLVHLAGAVILYFLALTTLTLPSLASKYPKAQEIAFITALIWAVHPLQTNSVTYIVQRMTSMAALFYLASLLCYARGRLAPHLSYKQYALFCGSFLFGLMAITSKENAYMLPVMIGAYELFFFTFISSIKNYKKILIWMTVSLCIIFTCVLLFKGKNIFFNIFDAYQYRDFDMSQRLLTESRVFFLYISLLILPLPSRLNINHDISLSTGLFTPLQTLFSLGGIFLFIALIFLLFKKNRVLAFGMTWFLVNLLLESTVIPLELIYEHRLYLPSTFLILGVTATIYTFFSQQYVRWFLRAGFLFILCLFCLWTWQRNQVWASNITLWSDVVSKSPKLARGYNNLGVALHDQGKFQEAEQQFIQAIEIDPDSKLGYQSLGSLYISQNRLQEAEQVLKFGLSKETYFSPARLYHYLGVVAQKAGRYQEAMQYANLALHLNKNDLDPLMTIGITYSKMGELQKADAAFLEAERQGVTSVDLYNNWGIIAFKLNLTGKSLEYFNKALEIDPNHPESHNNLGLAYGKLGMMEEARREMKTAMRLKQAKK